MINIIDFISQFLTNFENNGIVNIIWLIVKPLLKAIVSSIVSLVSKKIFNFVISKLKQIRKKRNTCKSELNVLVCYCFIVYDENGFSIYRLYELDQQQIR